MGLGGQRCTGDPLTGGPMCDRTQTISPLSFSFLPSNVETQLPTPGVVERVSVGAAGEVLAGPSSRRGTQAGEGSRACRPRANKGCGEGEEAPAPTLPRQGERPSLRDAFSRPPRLGRECREAGRPRVGGQAPELGRLPGGGSPWRHGGTPYGPFKSQCPGEGRRAEGGGRRPARPPAPRGRRLRSVPAAWLRLTSPALEPRALIGCR